ncbi:MAG: hypothetical protein IJJ85_07260 [Clostridia bacterium]|nr:hypothetical protein [Clostridia bacterium]
MELTIDFSRPVAPMRPVHGFNNAARQLDYGEILPDFLALRPPVVRLHDAAYPYGGGHYVDVDNIFRDKTADPEDPGAYDFTLTDLYILPLREAGIDVMYRLGCTIEHAPKKYNVYPPEDPEKWASVCEHIVRHYNCGWADGYTLGIRYWEIWNEPDGTDPKIEPNGPPNWAGTAEQYYALYTAAAKHIKRLHPDVLVGGYSSCYILGKNVGGKWTPGPTDFFTDFLSYVKAENAPLDFFTWHGYLGNQGTKKIDREFAFVDRTLNDYGFSETLRIDAEWNCCICDEDTPDYRRQFYINMQNEKGASHVMAALIEMQRAGVDMAMYYDAQLWKEYGGLFLVPSLEPTKTYAAFRLFEKLYRQGTQVLSDCAEEVYTLAAAGAQRLFLLANTNPEPKDVVLHICGADAKSLLLTNCDAENDASQRLQTELTEKNGSLQAEITMPAYSFAYGELL